MVSNVPFVASGEMYSMNMLYNASAVEDVPLLILDEVQTGVGRVGTLTVAFAFSRSVVSRNYKYPEGHTMVG